MRNSSNAFGSLSFLQTDAGISSGYSEDNYMITQIGGEIAKAPRPFAARGLFLV